MVRPGLTTVLAVLTVAVLIAVAFVAPAYAQTSSGEESWGPKQGANTIPYLLFVGATLTVIFLMIRSSKSS